MKITKIFSPYVCLTKSKNTKKEPSFPVYFTSLDKTADLFFPIFTHQDIDACARHIIDCAEFNNMPYSTERIKKLYLKLISISNSLKAGKVIISKNKNNEIVSSCGLENFNFPPQTSINTGEVFGVYTKKDYQGQGLASKMLKSLLDWAFENHYKYISLETRNPIAERLYEKFGFKQISLPDEKGKKRMALALA